MPTIYELLGLTAGADPEQVKAAFHRLAKSSHPDVNSGDASAEGRFKQINQAYEILGDPERRAAYDLGLKHRHHVARLRVRNVMATTAASFMITVGCGLCFLPSAPSGQEPRTTILTTEMSTPPPLPAAPQTTHERVTRPKVASARQSVHPSVPPADERGTKIAASAVDGGTSLQADPQTQREQALHLYAKGMEQIGQGNVLAARSFFALAAKAGLQRSLRALAGTYDPVQLDKLKVLGMQPDVEAARSWYEKAGDLAAAARLGMGEEWGLSTADKPSSRRKRDSISVATETSRD
jgi:curved DNA-binding protein CbpA